MAKHSNQDVICPSCNGRVFYIGTQYNCNGNPAYTLRCANCRGRNGEGTYVKNVPFEIFDKLRREGRIVAGAMGAMGAMPRPQEPTGQMTPDNISQGNVPRQANPNPVRQGTPIVPTLGVVPNQGIASSQMTVPTPPNVQMPAQEVVPFDIDPVAPPPYKPVVANTGERTVLNANCPACQMKKPISVEGTEFSVILSNSELTYLNKYTGQVIFMHKIAYCPYCGSRLK